MSDSKKEKFDFDFQKLPQPARAFAFVGYYLWNFSMFEQRIVDVISDVLNVNILQGAIIGRNLEFSDKIYTLRSLIWFGVADKDLQTRYDGAVKNLVERHAANRNIIAHSAFRDEGDGVLFLTTKAKKKLEMEGLFWDEAKFHDEILDMDRITTELKHLQDHIAFDRLAKQLPFGRLGGLGGFMAGSNISADAGHLTPSIQELLGIPAETGTEDQQSVTTDAQPVRPPAAASRS
jgi:hypothetical protein